MLAVEATLVESVNHRSDAKANGKSQLTTNSVNPIMVGGNDDAHQSDGWVEQNSSANPTPSSERPHCKSTPT